MSEIITAKGFNKDVLDSVFENIERVPDDRFAAYQVLDEYGSSAGTISCLGGDVIRVYVDNFPRQKKILRMQLPDPNFGPVCCGHGAHRT